MIHDGQRRSLPVTPYFGLVGCNLVQLVESSRLLSVLSQRSDTHDCGNHECHTELIRHQPPS